MALIAVRHSNVSKADATVELGGCKGLTGAEHAGQCKIPIRCRRQATRGSWG